MRTPSPEEGRSFSSEPAVLSVLPSHQKTKAKQMSQNFWPHHSLVTDVRSHPVPDLPKLWPMLPLFFFFLNSPHVQSELDFLFVACIVEIPSFICRFFDGHNTFLIFSRFLAFHRLVQVLVLTIHGFPFGSIYSVEKRPGRRRASTLRSLEAGLHHHQQTLLLLYRQP